MFRKYLMYTSIIVFFLIGCKVLETQIEPDKNKSDFENILISQKAKKIIIYSYKPKESNGQVVKDTLLGYTEYILGNFEIKGHVFDSLKKITGNLIYEYDKNWNRIKYTNRVLDTIIYQEKRNYNSSNKLTDMCVVYYQRAKLNTCIKYMYNSKGLLIQEIQYDHTGKTQWKFEYVYDSIGRIKNTLLYDINGAISTTESMTYDTFNNIIEKIAKYESGLFDSEINEYDERGNVIKVTKYYGDEFVKNILEEKRFEYEYDKQGNRIRLIEFKGVVPVSFYESVIYY